jgi:hypothetical protein
VTVLREGMAGIMDVLRIIEDPEEYEPGHIPELRKLLTDLAHRVLALGNLANEMDREINGVRRNADLQNYGLSAGMALECMEGDRDALREIATAMRGRVRVDLGNLDESPTVREVNERRGAEPDGPVADSVDGYKVQNEMEEK